MEDSRLVVLNARDAEARGARIMPRTRVLSAEREGDLWVVTVQRGEAAPEVIRARALVNAGGPWAGDVRFVWPPTASWPTLNSTWDWWRWGSV